MARILAISVFPSAQSAGGAGDVKLWGHPTIKREVIRGAGSLRFKD
jgi:hypothetical protein